MGWKDRCSVSELIGKTLVAVRGCEKGSDSVTFECADGSEYRMYHDQDCCESVAVEDVAGDIAHLIGSPLLKAEESSNTDDPRPSEWAESWTWTFYNFATIQGYVTLRWLGESNGYYGEGVDFERTSGPTLSVLRSPSDQETP